MTAVRGKQLEDSAISTVKLADNALAASASGRGKMQDGFFDLTTVGLKFAASSIADTKLVESYIKADGTRAFTGAQSLGGFKITNLANGTAATDAVNYSQISAATSGLYTKSPARVATIQKVSLDGTTPVYSATGGTSARGQITWTTGPTSLDGVTLANADRMLLKNEGDGGGLGAAANGIWVRTSANTWDRATDFDEDTEVKANSYLWIEEGTVNQDSAWVLTTNNPITIGGASGTALTFVLFASATAFIAGAGLAKTGNTIDVVAADASITVNADSIQVGYGSIVAADAGANANGTAATASRSDHKHQVTTGTPSTTVKSDATSASTGTATSLIRTDAQLVVLTATVTDVGTANSQGSSTSLARADHVHKSFFATTSNKNMTAAVTTADNQSATATTIAATPAGDGYVQVFINGIMYQVGDGTKVGVPTYFSGDAGSTARAIASIVSGDGLYFNGSVAGFQLDATDRIDFCYEA